jgi:hypothetical protein
MRTSDEDISASRKRCCQRESRILHEQCQLRANELLGSGMVCWQTMVGYSVITTRSLDFDETGA